MVLLICFRYCFTQMIFSQGVKFVEFIFPNITKFIAYIAKINNASLFPAIQFTILEAFENYTVSSESTLHQGRPKKNPSLLLGFTRGLFYFFLNLPLWVLLWVHAGFTLGLLGICFKQCSVGYNR